MLDFFARKIYAAAAGVVGSSMILSAAWAQTAPPATDAFSIRECIQYANVHNSGIRTARIDEQIARQQTNEIKGRGLPQANINGTFEDRLKIPLLIIPGGFGGIPGGDSTGTGGAGSPGGDNARGQGIPMGFKYNSSLSGEVTQMIVDPSFWIGLKAAKASSIYYQQTTQRVSEDAAYNIANAYYQVIVVQKQLDLLRTNLASTQTILSNTEVQFRNGVAKKVDVDRLRVNASNLQSQIRQAELSLTQVMNALKFQMGMPIEQTIVLSDTSLTFRQDEAVLDAPAENYLENRVDYRLLQTNRQLLELDRKNNASGYLPTLRAFANYGYVAQGPEFGFFRTPGNGWVDYTVSSIGLRLNIPVFDGLQRSARNQQAKLSLKKTDENINLARQSIKLEVSNALTQYRNTLERIDAEQQNVELAQEVYQVTQLEFREGVGTSTSVVEAETALRRAQNTYIDTLLDLYAARLDLERAKGTIFSYIDSIE
jgi:outer membrane protein